MQPNGLDWHFNESDKIGNGQYENEDNNGHEWKDLAVVKNHCPTFFAFLHCLPRALSVLSILPLPIAAQS